tara:strand:+ start:4136 stop:4567 length:432 start_codon:yes stop_codon:yes gene_type:complete
MNTFQNNYKKKKLKIVNHPKGKIIKLLDINDDYFSKFGELYISEIKKNKVKAWKFHKKNCLNIFVLEGKVKFAFAYKKKNGWSFKTVLINTKIHQILHIPNSIWFGFKGLHKSNKLLSLSNKKFSEKELLRKKIDDFNFNWGN